MPDTDARSNPYVGPRAFTSGEKLYGRDRELRELQDILIAERIVLLYSPSGAGKSSLIQAGLIPALLEEGFHVMPLVRLNYEPPVDLLQKEEFNRYTFSAIQSLEETLPEEQCLPGEIILELTLAEYLTQRTKQEDQPDTEVLIFDQFEEVLTVDVTDQEVKANFFSQLGTALRDRKRWVIFSIREDYVGALTPYLRPIPTRLSNTFRLELLGKDAARQAIQQPAKNAGVGFQDEAVSKLVDDLRRIRIQRPDGTIEKQLGLYVEPVQLQVVCFRLWENLPPDAGQITQTHIESVGSVDTALADYYAERVSIIAEETGVSERVIRDWFEHQLITEQGLRGQVLRAPKRSGGLDNQAIRLLGNAHLIRAEQRGGATWFELAHDRLIEPVQQNNKIWLETNLSLLQRQAVLWASQGRPDSLLLKDQALEEAQHWASDHSAEMSPVDVDFLEESQAEMERQQAEERAREAKRLRRWNRLISGVGALAIALAITAAFLGWRAYQNGLEAKVERAIAVFAKETAQVDKDRAVAAEGTAQADKDRAIKAEETAQADKDRAVAAEGTAQAEKDRAETAEATAVAAEKFSRSRELAALSINVLEQQRDLAYLLGLEALEAADTLQARNALLSGLQLALSRNMSPIHPSPGTQPLALWTVSLSPDGGKLAFAGEFGLVKVWDIQGGVFTKLNRTPDPNERRVRAVAFSSDGETLFTGNEEGVIKTWDVQSGEKIKIDFKADRPIFAMAVSPDGNTLAYAGSGRNVNLVNADFLVESTGLLFTREPRADVLSIAWSPDSTRIMTGDRNGAIRVYDVDSEEVLFSTKEHEGSVNSVAWSPGGKWLASGGDDNRGNKDKTLILWDWESGESIPIVDHTEDVFGVAFSPDGKILAAGSEDGTLTLYDVDTRRKIEQRMDHSELISSVAFNTLGIPILASGGMDQKVELYKIATQQPLGNLFTDGKGSLKSLQFLSNQELLMLGSQSNDSTLWQAQIEDMKMMGEEELLSSPEIPTAAVISVEGNQLVFGYENSTIDIWEVQPDGTFTELENLDLGAGPIYSLAIDVNDDTLAVGICSSAIELIEVCENNVIQLWSISSKTLLDTLEGSSGKVTSLAFSPIEDLLAAGTQDQKIELWLQEDGNGYELSSELSFSSGLGFSSLEFDSQGILLAVGTNIGEVLMLDINTLSLYGDAFIGASGPVTSLAFSPDSLILASGTQTGYTILWDLNLDLWKERACELAGRNMTIDEWEKYVRLPDYQATCPQYPDG